MKFNSFFMTDLFSENMSVDPAEDTKNSAEDVAPETNREPVEGDTPLASVEQPEGGQEGKERSSGRLF